MTQSIVFAVPGDLRTLTGGYLYDLNLLTALGDLGVNVRHLEWGRSFPGPTPQDMSTALGQLQALPADCPALVDGLAYGVLDTEGLRTVSAPLFALVHHPLALEPGLRPEAAGMLAARELANLAIARHIFVTSSHTRAVLRDRYDVDDSRITVVLPGFDQPPMDGTSPKSAPPLILSVGILAQRKGHDILLRALAQISDLDWQADIVGREHEAGGLKVLTALIAQLGLGTRVRLSGEVGADDLTARYRQASLFALATRYEGYGIVFGEAMGHGLPIVSTRAGAVPDTVGPDAGLLVPSDDPVAFAGALRRMLCEPQLRDRCTQANLNSAKSLARWADSATLVKTTIARLCASS